MKECTCKNCGWDWMIEKNDSHPFLCHKCGFDNKLNTFDMESLKLWKKSQIAKGEKPYIEERNDNVIRRTFSNSVNENELVWHVDKVDRVVIILSETDWSFQLDNGLPKKLNVGDELFIPKETYHRVIKGNNDLNIEIIETEFSNEVLEEGEKKKRDACYYKVKSRYKTWPSAYGSGALVKCRKVGAANWGNKTDESTEEVSEAKKTDFSKEKEKGLHGWFERQGGKGKSKGWVDCNTCRKDPETGRKKCKSCGRKEGEERAKYPACRPTPSACSTQGKGDSWGKKAKNESLINEKMVLSNYDDYSKIVAQAYVNAPDFDQSVVPSYKALMVSTKRLFKQLQSKLKVEFVDYDPYESREQMNNEVKETGVLKITKLFNEHPLYTKEENLMLRAVHDYYTHIIANQDFGLKGELRAYNTHAKLAPPAALPALFTEVVGQVSYAIVHGDFTKQKICKLEGFDYKNVGKIDNMDIVKKQLQIDKKESVNESIWTINPNIVLKK